MAIMGINIEKETQLIAEMEESGLIQFDELGNVGLLVLEGQSWTYPVLNLDGVVFKKH